MRKRNLSVNFQTKEVAMKTRTKLRLSVTIAILGWLGTLVFLDVGFAYLPIVYKSTNSLTTG